MKHTNLNALNLNVTEYENEAMHYGYEYPHTHYEPVYEPAYMDGLTDLELEALYAF